jgi:hypothetical protein
LAALKFETPPNPDVNRVLAIFKCHLDAGFMDTQNAVVHRYFSERFPRAITIAEQSASPEITVMSGPPGRGFFMPSAGRAR